MSEIAYIGKSGRDPDNILRQAIGEVENVVVVGEQKDGGIYMAASGNLSLAELNYLLDKVKMAILECEEE